MGSGLGKTPQIHAVLLQPLHQLFAQRCLVSSQWWGNHCLWSQHVLSAGSSDARKGVSCSSVLLQVGTSQFTRSLCSWVPVPALSPNIPETVWEPGTKSGPPHSEKKFRLFLRWGTSLVVKNLPCDAEDVGSTPGQRTGIPHAAEQLSLCAPTRESTQPGCHD